MKTQTDCCDSMVNSFFGEAHANNIIKVGSQKTYGASITGITRQMIFIEIGQCVCSEKQNNLTDKFYGQTVLFNTWK